MKYYCTVNVFQGKINHIYGSSTDRETCLAMTDRIGFGLNLRTKFYPYCDKLISSVNKKPGLPMVISVVTDNESEVKDLVFAGKYTIEQKYEYSATV